MHKVTVRKGFTGPHRQRAGISVSREYPYVGELDPEQLKAIEADPELVVEDSKEEGSEEAPREMVDVQPTKKELLDQAKAEGLELEGINARSKVSDVKAALEAARTKGTESTEDTTEEETVTQGDDRPIEGDGQDSSDEPTESEETQTTEPAEDKKD